MNALKRILLTAASLICMASAPLIWAEDPPAAAKAIACIATLYCAITAANKAMKGME